MRLRQLSGAVVAVAAVLVAGSAAGQSGRTTVDPPVPIPEREFHGTQPADAITETDLAALRYYLRSGQDAKYDAEVARLRRRNPDWSPPDDLLDPSGGPDVQPLWDLYAEGEYAEVSARIARLKQADPDWSPPDNLVRQLELAKQRQRLINASDSEQWGSVVRIANDYPALMRCGTVDLMWRTAAAHAERDARDRAKRLYRDILETCPDTAVRVATLQKADAHLYNGDVRELIKVAQANDPDDKLESAIADIQRDLYRSRLAGAASGRYDLSERALERYADTARARRSANMANALGWYYQNRDAPSTAAPWFERSMDWGGGASPALGLTLARRQQGEPAAAERIARDWYEGSTPVAEAYVGLATDRLAAAQSVDDERLARYAELASARENADLATALGWEHYDNQRYDTAVRWFDNALDWGPSESAAEGLILAHDQAGRRDEAEAALDRWTAEYPDLAGSLSTGGGAAGPVSQAAAAGDYGRCVRAAAELAGTDGYDAGTALQHGWCLLALDRPAEAERRFSQARELTADGSPAGGTDVRAEAMAGRANALLALGQPRAAMDLLRDADLDAGRARDLTARALASYAYTAMERERYREVLEILRIRRRYAPPTRGLRTVKGWAYYNIGRNARAVEIFSDLDQEFSTEATRNALSTAHKFTR